MLYIGKKRKTFELFCGCCSYFQRLYSFVRLKTLYVIELSVYFEKKTIPNMTKILK